MAFSRDLRLYWWSPARVIGLGLLPCPIRYFGVLKISKTSSLRLIMSNGRKDQNRARWLLGTGDWLKKIGDGFFVELGCRITCCAIFATRWAHFSEVCSACFVGITIARSAKLIHFLLLAWCVVPSGVHFLSCWAFAPQIHFLYLPKRAAFLSCS